MKILKKNLHEKPIGRNHGHMRRNSLYQKIITKDSMIFRDIITPIYNNEEPNIRCNPNITGPTNNRVFEVE